MKFFKNSCLVLASILFFSCSDDKETIVPISDKTITEVVNTNADFSLLKTALVHADLLTTLNGAGPFTVFAPNNEAFEKSGFTSENSIKAIPSETLKNILLYHVLGNKTVSTAIPTAMNTSVTTAKGDNLFVSKYDKGVFINGSKVINADINAKNGVIHVIDRVLIPADGNVVTTALNNENFTYLVAAVLRASEGAVDVKSALESAGPLTVFAPTNQAFIDAGFPTIASIQAADPATLTSILTTHVLSARVFSNQVENNLSVTTLGQSSLLFNINSNVTVKGSGNAAPATITGFDMLTTNGVIHVIDKVLLP